MNLTGKRILVVEDDRAAGERVCAQLREAGAVALGPAPTPFYALQLLGRRGVDGAVLDIRLHGDTVFGLADELVRRGTPILFAMDTDSDDLPDRHRQRPRLVKPFAAEDLFALLLAAQAPPAPAETMPVEPQVAPIPVVAGAAASPHLRIARAVGAALRRHAGPPISPADR